ncbi:glycogen/starch/alpha-glucan phosphorylase [Methylocella tundrae]|uniref:Alpha-1,4 glucan phosphorylase n=1 Tax=Methylocella tundrae TaxID=227605 RepID=A0A4U8YWD9_METTU|nr:glycogen/starch/alpha-glucan phosphorylase [Methylocella tundrae]WPP05695.1 glycogen/starch/alpha-glucan phosphorylase [Methylocella tundrae]VFU08177.1 glycogen phosphorylase [Methylocella tundrae]
MDLETHAASAADAAAPAVETQAIGEDVAAIRDLILAKLKYSVGKSVTAASPHDWFVATALSVRDKVVESWLSSIESSKRTGRKRVYYLSLEFLIGRLLIDALTNMEMIDETRAALAEFGVDLETLREVEDDAALGNGGLGRLAACFMESMATLSIAAYGYGIRYDHGLFRQRIKNGRQLEYPEDWLSFGNPWEFQRPEIVCPIGFGGHIDTETRPDGELRQVWHPGETVEALAYDTPIPGWRGAHINTLRLWSARAVDPLRLDQFNSGDHIGALMDRVRAESISKVLYPGDTTPAGQELRLRQEFFFASASLQDLVRRHISLYGDVRTLADKAAIQLNDTHPAIAVAELMHILVDLHDIPWDEAWAITQATFSYTNHTLLPEALETWPVPLMERLLPRHMQIIYLINALHLAKVSGEPDATGHRLAALSLIDESHGRRVRMGHLAFLGSHKVNGVSQLHSDLMKTTVFHDLESIAPGKITNKTNGITFRRWLKEANPGLTSLLMEVVGDNLLDNAMVLEKVAALADDSSFQERYAAIRRANKMTLARLVQQRIGVKLNPDALFDVHIKRIHEYKRQVLNILEAVTIYDEIRAQPFRDWIPRVKIFAGKAAASYTTAKLIIQLANDVGKVINSDPALRGLLKVVFLPNYNVSLAERIIPAADLSEQISTAGMEASGTGNMKFALNGALTIGTLDGANVEIMEHVGSANIFIFGLTADEVEAKRSQGISGQDAIARSPKLSEALESIASGVFSPDEPHRYRGLVDALTYHDFFLVTADFDAYYNAQRAVFRRWRDKPAWWRSAILNTAHMGWFSSDRTIAEYAEEIWNVPVTPPGRK